MLIRPLLFRREREKNKVNGSLSRVPSLSLSAKKKKTTKRTGSQLQA